MVVITSHDREVIFDAVRKMYTEVASHPGKAFHFPTGRTACEAVGYPTRLLDRLPPRAVESFVGVGYPFTAEVIGPGSTVLDIGSGSGTDVFTALRRTGPEGAVIGLDMTAAMREKLLDVADSVGATNVRALEGNAESIGLPDAAVDAVTSNGVLNLAPDKPAAIAEIFRVLRPGGGVQISDIVLGTDPSAACRREPQLWAECIVGATREEDYLEHFRAAGFIDVETLDRHDYFELSSSEETRDLARSLGAISITLTARKPL